MRAIQHAVLCLILLPNLIAEAGLPNPYARNDQPWIGPGATPTIEHMFWIELPVAPDTDLHVATPDGVRLLDQTDPGKDRTRTRLYFRADRALRDAPVTIGAGGGKTYTVPLTVRTYRQDIEHHIRAVPGIDPSVRKQGRCYYTDDLITTARANMQAYPKLKDDLTRPTRFDDLTDDQLWRYFPPWTVPRQCYSTWPCPKCGDSIFAKSGYYAWVRDPNHPFKAKCPECGGLYPTNDWRNDDFTSGTHPDDGWGFDPGTGRRDDRYAWIAYYNHHAVWQCGEEIRQLALRSLLLGDRGAAHRAGVLLARLAYVYPGLNLRWQQVRSKYLRPGRALIDGAWERYHLLVPALQAYDAMWDVLDDDPDLVAFLQGKDPFIRSTDDVKALLDTYLVQLVGWDWMRRELSGGNQGAREQNMADFILCCGMPHVADRWLAELFTHAYNSGINRGGFDDATLVNRLNREGPTLISGLGYAAHCYLPSKSDMAESLSRITNPRWRERCDLYDPQRYPKFRAEFDTWLDVLCAGQFCPSYGDAGGARAQRYPKGLAPTLSLPYDRAYRRWKTDRLARAVVRRGKHAPPLFEPDVWPDAAAQAAKAPPEPPLASRVIDGFGFVLLESRPHATDITDRAAVAVRYGYSLGHHHGDNLNIEMWAHGQGVTPELGYPCWAHPMGNTSFVAHHNTGMIDGKDQYPGGVGHGTLELFAAAPALSFADVSAEPAYFDNRLYRRAICLVDAPDGHVYLLDIFRMAGGKRRTYCSHGPAHKAFEAGLDFGDVTPGPWQGIDAKARPWGKRYRVNIVDAQTATADRTVWADWTADKGDLRLRLHLLAQPGRRYVTARCAKTDIPPIRYLFAEDQADDRASEFLAVWEPYTTSRFIERIERLPVDASGDSELKPAAVRVILTGGRVDTFLYRHTDGPPIRVNDIVFNGRFGYLQHQGGTLRRLHLVAGTTLTCDGAGIRRVPAWFRTRVRSVDHDARTLVLAEPLPAGADLGGKLLHLASPTGPTIGGPHRTAYPIEDVASDRRRVRLKHHALVHRSRVIRVADDGAHLVAELPPCIPGTGGVNPKSHYDGMMLTGEDHLAAYRIRHVDGATIAAHRPLRATHFPDADNDGRRMLFIYDFGPGERVTLHNAAFADTTSRKATVSWGKLDVTWPPLPSSSRQAERPAP